MAALVGVTPSPRSGQALSRSEGACPERGEGSPRRQPRHRRCFAAAQHDRTHQLQLDSPLGRGATRQMDEPIRRILGVLAGDACASAEQIATMLGLEVEYVRREIGRLERERIVVGRKALINWEKAGEESVWALIEVRVSPQRDVGFDAIANRIARYPE